MIDVAAAHKRIAPYIHRTPVLQSTLLNDLVDAELFFKCENLQKVGAFKARGACNAVLSLTDENATKGVATHSSGNHGAALAWAAAIRDIPATIVVPNNAKQIKKDAILSYGGQIVECEPTLAAREATLADVVAVSGANFIPPYDDDRIISGQGTAALEIVDQVEDLNAAITPVGGGGLLAGCLLGFKDSGIAVFGAEPEGADDAYRSLKQGARIASHSPNTLCDGLLTTLGEKNFDIIRDRVTDILLVSDDEVVEAMTLIWTRLKLVVEPSSAIVLAAVIRNKAQFKGQRIVLVLSGGNVDLTALPF